MREEYKIGDTIIVSNELYVATWRKLTIAHYEWEERKLEDGTWLWKITKTPKQHLYSIYTTGKSDPYYNRRAKA